MINLIMAVNKRGLLAGPDGSIPWHSPHDLMYFKATTTHRTLIVGSTTFKTLPPMPDRDLIVLTRDPKAFCPPHRKNFGNIWPTNDVQSLIKAFSGPDLECWVIGGYQVYDLFVEHAAYMSVSHIADDTECGLAANPDWFGMFDDSFVDYVGPIRVTHFFNDTSAASLIKAIGPRVPTLRQDADHKYLEEARRSLSRVLVRSCYKGAPIVELKFDGQSYYYAVKE